MDGFKDFNAKDFYVYLRDKGFTGDGANQVLNHVVDGCLSREDFYQLKSFWKDNGIRERPYYVIYDMVVICES